MDNAGSKAIERQAHSIIMLRSIRLPLKVTPSTTAFSSDERTSGTRPLYPARRSSDSKRFISTIYAHKAAEQSLPIPGMLLSAKSISG